MNQDRSRNIYQQKPYTQDHLPSQQQSRVSAELTNDYNINRELNQIQSQNAFIGATIQKYHPVSTLAKGTTQSSERPQALISSQASTKVLLTNLGRISATATNQNTGSHLLTSQVHTTPNSNFSSLMQKQIQAKHIQFQQQNQSDLNSNHLTITSNCKGVDGHHLDAAHSSVATSQYTSLHSIKNARGSQPAQKQKVKKFKQPNGQQTIEGIGLQVIPVRQKHVLVSNFVTTQSQEKVSDCKLTRARNTDAQANVKKNSLTKLNCQQRPPSFQTQQQDESQLKDRTNTSVGSFLSTQNQGNVQTSHVMNRAGSTPIGHGNSFGQVNSGHQQTSQGSGIQGGNYQRQTFQHSGTLHSHFERQQTKMEETRSGKSKLSSAGSIQSKIKSSEISGKSHSSLSPSRQSNTHNHKSSTKKGSNSQLCHNNYFPQTQMSLNSSQELKKIAIVQGNKYAHIQAGTKVFTLPSHMIKANNANFLLNQELQSVDLVENKATIKGQDKIKLSSSLEKINFKNEPNPQRTVSTNFMVFGESSNSFHKMDVLRRSMQTVQGKKSNQNTTSLKVKKQQQNLVLSNRQTNVKQFMTPQRNTKGKEILASRNGGLGVVDISIEKMPDDLNHASITFVPTKANQNQTKAQQYLRNSLIQKKSTVTNSVLPSSQATHHSLVASSISPKANITSFSKLSYRQLPSNPSQNTTQNTNSVFDHSTISQSLINSRTGKNSKSPVNTKIFSQKQLRIKNLNVAGVQKLNLVNQNDKQKLLIDKQTYKSLMNYLVNAECTRIKQQGSEPVSSSTAQKIHSAIPQLSNSTQTLTAQMATNSSDSKLKKAMGEAEKSSSFRNLQISQLAQGKLANSKGLKLIPPQSSSSQTPTNLQQQQMAKSSCSSLSKKKYIIANFVPTSTKNTVGNMTSHTSAEVLNYNEGLPDRINAVHSGDSSLVPASGATNFTTTSLDNMPSKVITTAAQSKFKQSVLTNNSKQTFNYAMEQHPLVQTQNQTNNKNRSRNINKIGGVIINNTTGVINKFVNENHLNTQTTLKVNESNETHVLGSNVTGKPSSGNNGLNDSAKVIKVQLKTTTKNGRPGIGLKIQQAGSTTAGSNSRNQTQTNVTTNQTSMTVGAESKKTTSQSIPTKVIKARNLIRNVCPQNGNQNISTKSSNVTNSQIASALNKQQETLQNNFMGLVQSQESLKPLKQPLITETLSDQQNSVSKLPRNLKELQLKQLTIPLLNYQGTSKIGDEKFVAFTKQQSNISLQNQIQSVKSSTSQDRVSANHLKTFLQNQDKNSLVNEVQVSRGGALSHRESQRYYSKPGKTVSTIDDRQSVRSRKETQSKTQENAILNTGSTVRKGKATVTSANRSASKGGSAMLEIRDKSLSKAAKEQNVASWYQNSGSRQQSKTRKQRSGSASSNRSHCQHHHHQNQIQHQTIQNNHVRNASKKQKKDQDLDKSRVSSKSKKGSVKQSSSSKVKQSLLKQPKARPPTQLRLETSYEESGTNLESLMEPYELINDNSDQRMQAKDEMIGTNFNTFGEKQHHSENYYESQHPKRNNHNESSKVEFSEDLEHNIKIELKSIQVRESILIQKDSNTGQKKKGNHKENSHEKQPVSIVENVNEVDNNSHTQSENQDTQHIHYSGSFGIPNLSHIKLPKHSKEVKPKPLKIKASNEKDEKSTIEKQGQHSNAAKMDFNQRGGGQAEPDLKKSFQLINMSFSQTGFECTNNSFDINNQTMSDKKLKQISNPHNSIAVDSEADPDAHKDHELQDSAKVLDTYQVYENMLDKGQNQNLNSLIDNRVHDVSSPQFEMAPQYSQNSDMDNSIATEVTKKLYNDKQYRKELLLRVLPKIDKLEQFDELYDEIDGKLINADGGSMISVSKDAANLLRQINKSLGRPFDNYEQSSDRYDNNNIQVLSEESSKDNQNDFLTSFDAQGDPDFDEVNTIVHHNNEFEFEEGEGEESQEDIMMCSIDNPDNQMIATPISGLQIRDSPTESSQHLKSFEMQTLSPTQKEIGSSILSPYFDQPLLVSNNTSTSCANALQSRRETNVLTEEGGTTEEERIGKYALKQGKKLYFKDKEDLRGESPATPSGGQPELYYDDDDFNTEEHLHGRSINVVKDSPYRDIVSVDMNGPEFPHRNDQNDSRHLKAVQSNNPQTDCQTVQANDTITNSVEANEALPQFGLARIVRENQNDFEEDDEDELLDQSFQTMRADDDNMGSYYDFDEQEESQAEGEQGITSFYGPEKAEYQEMVSMMKPLADEQNQLLDEKILEKITMEPNEEENQSGFTTGEVLDINFGKEEMSTIKNKHDKLQKSNM